LDILDLGANGEHLGGLAYGQDVFNAIYNMLTVSQHLKLIAVSGDKYSREKLMNTKDKLMELMCWTRPEWTLGLRSVLMVEVLKKNRRSGQNTVGQRKAFCRS
jgi:hypothetical protein